MQGQKSSGDSPGAGRQFCVLSPLAREYDIADISTNILNKNIYDGAEKYWINNYSDYTNNKYDIVTFWFVIHHVLPEELESFIGFISRHLSNKGLVIFNSPLKCNKQTLYNNDGIKTSIYKKHEVMRAFVKEGFTLLERIDYGINEFFIFTKDA
ncbi:MAG: class I SAM-dependent methyltransferase [Anaerolineales bacterium]|nr:class I SAM-dependent methyltransferase [Anaerolineales bacterium]